MPSARENILNRILEVKGKREQVVLEEPDLKSPIYVESNKPAPERFKENLEKVGGKVYRFNDINEAIDQIKKMAEEEKWDPLFCKDKKIQGFLKDKVPFTDAEKDFVKLKVGITPCEFLITHLGSTMISSSGDSGRRLHVYPITHIILAHEGQLVDHLDDAINGMIKRYGESLPSLISTLTGPSRSADIEKTLIKGMHGPKRFFVFLCHKPF